MTSKQTTQTQKKASKKDFSHYKWFEGKNAKFDALSLSTYEGRIFVGAKGWDRRQNGAGYIRVEIQPEALAALVAEAQAVLAS